MIDLFTADFQQLDNDALYNAIAEFARVSPNESNRHDFKLQWTNETMQDVAAFANTFGGLLFVGIAKGQNDAHATLVGVESDAELTTGIAMAISTNISPTPVYDIAECYKPGDTRRKFCVIRVKNSSTISLVTKKGLSPAWLRDADRTIRADAAQLRWMIDRERNFEIDSQGLLTTSVYQMFDQMFIGIDYPVGDNWAFGPSQRSQTFFKIALVPTSHNLLRLDRNAENKFLNLVRTYYRRISTTLTGTQPAQDAEERAASYYEYRWFHKNLKYENRWRVTDQLLVAHATQIDKDHEWSLTDIVLYTLLILKVASKWWESVRYFGDGLLVASLFPMDLPLARGASQQYTTLFNPGEGSFGMNADVLATTVTRKPASQAFVNVSFANMRDAVPEVVTLLFNVLLRDLGHAIIWDDFKENVRKIWEGQRP